MHLRLISTLVPPPNAYHSDVPDISPLTKTSFWSQLQEKAQSTEKSGHLSPFLSTNLLSLQIQWFGCLFSLKIDYLDTRHGSCNQNVTNLRNWYNRTKVSHTIEQKFTHVWSPLWSLGRKWTMVIPPFCLYKYLPWRGIKPPSPITLKLILNLPSASLLWKNFPFPPLYLTWEWNLF